MSENHHIAATVGPIATKYGASTHIGPLFERLSIQELSAEIRDRLAAKDIRRRWRDSGLADLNQADFNH